MDHRERLSGGSWPANRGTMILLSLPKTESLSENGASMNSPVSLFRSQRGVDANALAILARLVFALEGETHCFIG